MPLCPRMPLLAAALLLGIAGASPAAWADAKSDVAAAAAAMQRGDAKTAVARLTAAIDSKQLSGAALGQAHRNRAAAELRLDDAPAAYQDLNRAVELLPNDSEIYALRCNLLIRRGGVDGARKDADTALKLDPRNAEAYQCRGLHGFVTRNFDKAIADFGEAIRLGITTPTIYNSRGLARAFKGDYDAAITDFDQAISLGTRSPASDRAEWLVNRARARSAKRQYDAALRDIGEAITLDAKAPERLIGWYAARARINAEKRDLIPAMDDIDQALRLAAGSEDPVRSPLLEDRGRINALAGNYEQATKDLTEALDRRKAILPGQVAEWYALRGRAYVAMGDGAKALADFDAALALRAGNPDVLAERGMVKLRRRDLDGAKADFDAALAKSADYAPALAGQGWLAAERGDTAGAVAAADRVVKLQRGNDLAYQLRGTFRFVGGQYEAAAADFAEAAKRDPSNPQAPVWRVMALARAGKPDTSIGAAGGAWPAAALSMFVGATDPAAVEAAARSGGSAGRPGPARGRECEAQFFIGEHWLARGDREKARAAFEKAVATDVRDAPEHAVARYELARLKKG